MITAGSPEFKTQVSSYARTCRLIISSKLMGLQGDDAGTLMRLLSLRDHVISHVSNYQQLTMTFPKSLGAGVDLWELRGQ